jgi:oligopeptide/dipeptide ABC transporter ATP-binding protein
MPEKLLTISDFKVRFGGVWAVDGVSLSVSRGEILAIVGESGSGKSVLARSVLGLAGVGAKISGRIAFLGQELTALKEAELSNLRGSELSLMVQDAQSALNPVYKVGAQLLETVALKHPLFKDSSKLPLIFRRRAERARMRQAALELLFEAGLSDPEGCYQSYPHQLSGGMRQRVMLAMAVLGSPKLLIADEPTTALDVVTQKQILEKLALGARKRGSSVVLISHDLHLVGELADSLVVLYAGRVMESGPAKKVLESPANPYTRDLLSATPKIGTKKGSLRPIPGDLPSPESRDAGCLFRSRCREAVQGCAQARSLIKIDNDWTASCARALAAGRPSPASWAA